MESTIPIMYFERLVAVVRRPLMLAAIERGSMGIWLREIRTAIGMKLFKRVHGKDLEAWAYRKERGEKYGIPGAS